jgi:hypothetical protein
MEFIKNTNPRVYVQEPKESIILEGVIINLDLATLAYTNKGIDIAN